MNTVIENSETYRGGRMAEETVYDVVIIGGGPGGLSAAQYTARAGLKTIVLDKSATAGALAYASKIENYPGLCTPMSGKELLDIFRRQAVDFGAEYAETQVVGVQLGDEIKEIFTMDGSYKGKSTIIATGSMGRKPTIRGEVEFLGRGVSYCAICDAAFYKGRTVCVIGESEEAVKEAGVLTGFAEKVYLIAPGKALKADPDHPALKEKNLEVMTVRPLKRFSFWIPKQRTRKKWPWTGFLSTSMAPNLLLIFLTLR